MRDDETQIVHEDAATGKVTKKRTLARVDSDQARVIYLETLIGLLADNADLDGAIVELGAIASAALEDLGVMIVEAAVARAELNKTNGRIAAINATYKADHAAWLAEVQRHEAEVERLTIIEAAAKRFVDMRNEWSTDHPDEVSLPAPLDFAGSALGAALYPDTPDPSSP